MGRARNGVSASAAAVSNSALSEAAGASDLGRRGVRCSLGSVAPGDSDGRCPVLTLSSVWTRVTCAHRVVCGWDRSRFTQHAAA